MVTYNRILTISAAGCRTATRWLPQKIGWDELLQKLSAPVRGQETMEAYLRMKKAEQDQRKDVGGFVGGELKDGVRKNSAVISRDIVTLDLDALPPGSTDDVLRKMQGLGCAYCVYSTRKHRPDKPRLRILIPLAQSVAAEKYEPIARKLAEMIGMIYCDPTTFQAVRMMYWPSVCAGSEYVFFMGDGPFADGEGILSLYSDWRDIRSWPQVPGAPDAYRSAATRQEDPTTKKGIVGVFCRVYNIYQAMDKFLPGVYTPDDTGDGRYTYAAGSTTGGAIVYDDGAFLYSHHGTDPAGGKLVNSFDLVRLHLYGSLDDDAEPRTPVNKLPSYCAMEQMARKDPVVDQTMRSERYEAALAEFGAAHGDLNWLQKLEITPKGEYAKTINNVMIILENDDRVSGRLRFDAFSNKIILTAHMPWDDERDYTSWRKNGTRDWTDADDRALRHYIEKTHHIKSPNDVADAVENVARNHGFNAVSEYLSGLRWDAERRLDTLLVDFLGAEDSLYTRAVTRKAFTAAAARALKPGVKFDNVLTLVGPQGIYKSTLLRLMGKDWFSDSLTSFDGKEAAEMIQGTWIVELSELESLNRSETSTVKQFLSKTEDIYREPYGRRTQAYPRRCAFFGTTNDRNFLRDRTGNRRFWPVAVSGNGRLSVTKDLDVDQLWAEAVVNYRFGEPLYLTTEEEKQASAEQQEEFSTRDEWEGFIQEFLDVPIPENWYSLDEAGRRMHLDAMARGQEVGYAVKPRDRVCAAEVLEYCFNIQRGRAKPSESARVNAIIRNTPGWADGRALSYGKSYGRQRGFKRVTD